MNNPFDPIMAELTAIRSEVQGLRDRLSSVQMVPKPEWITIEAYAEQEGVSKATVRRWIREGKLEAQDIGGKRRVRA